MTTTTLIVTVGATLGAWWTVLFYEMSGNR